MAPVSPPAPLGRPQRPARTGILWLLPTAALTLVTWGVLVLIDTNGEVPAALYGIAPLAIAGVALLVGAFVGRAGGVAAFGAIAAVVGLTAASFHGIDLRAGDVRIEPRQADQVASRYTGDVGEFTLDLTRLDDPARLVNRTITVEHRIGELRVIVPSQYALDISASVDGLGGWTLPGREGGGINTSTRLVLPQPVGVAGSSPSQPIVLDLNTTLGQIVVERR